MKNHLKMWTNKFLSALLIVALSSFSALAKKTEEVIEPDPALYDLNFTEMLTSVPLGDASEIIKKHQQDRANDLLKKYEKGRKEGVTIETFRNKEILVVTIPAKLLFNPNETLLADNAKTYLDPIKDYFKQPDNYRILLVMHTDNTGSPLYREDITEERVESVFEYYENLGLDTSYLFAYNMADDYPLVPNDSQENRDKNRRLEIYLMPGEYMVKQAKSLKK